jgi:hypothetical protein
VPVVGVGTIGELENVLTPATVSVPVRCTTAESSARPVTAPVRVFTDATAPPAAAAIVMVSAPSFGVMVTLDPATRAAPMTSRTCSSV